MPAATSRCLGKCNGRWLAKTAHDGWRIVDVNHYVSFSYDTLELRGLKVDTGNKRTRFAPPRDLEVVTCSKCEYSLARLGSETWGRHDALSMDRWSKSRDDALYELMHAGEGDNEQSADDQW
jgi:hypothetical protein